MDEREVMLTLAGAVVGALLMTKINVGLFAVAAIVVAFVVGNDQYGKRFRTVVATGGVLLPFVLMVQKLWEVGRAQFALLVRARAPALVRSHATRRRVVAAGAAIWVMARAAIVVMVVSVVWPLANGTRSDRGRARRAHPCGPSGGHPRVDPPGRLRLDRVHRHDRRRRRGAGEAASGAGRGLGPPWLAPGALGLAGLYVLGLVTLPGLLHLPTGFLAWLPAIAMLPALAWIAAAPAKFRLVLRLLVPLAILQILHAYPSRDRSGVGGWSRRAFRACSRWRSRRRRVPAWRHAGRSVHGAAIAGPLRAAAPRCGPLPDQGVARLLAAHAARPPRRAPGAAREGRRHDDPGPRHVRAAAVRHVLLGAGLRQPLHLHRPARATGLLSNWPGALTTGEQRELGEQLTQARTSGERVCIVRNLKRFNLWVASSYEKGPLGQTSPSTSTGSARSGSTPCRCYRPAPGEAGATPAAMNA